MKQLYISIAIVAAVLFTSCVKEQPLGLNGSGSSGVVDIPVNISATYPTPEATTRADDNGFSIKDIIGIFVVNYKSDGHVGELESSDTYVSNVPYEFTGNLWKAPYAIYWDDHITPADIYGYYPYNASIKTPTAYGFTINSVQDSNSPNTTAGAGYDNSDLLWAKAEKVYPTAESINLRYKHLMAGVTISLEMGTGFTEDEWSTLSKTIIVGPTQLTGTVNLQDGSVVANNGTSKTITPLQYNGVWRAVVMPQTIEAGTPLIVVDVDGQSYRLIKDVDMTYHSGKMHNFTLTVNKRSASGDYEFKLLSDDIVAWIDDPDFHDGIVREYIIINSLYPGTLHTLLEERGYDYGEVHALKISGRINHDDLRFIRDNLSYLTALNLRDATIAGDYYERDCIANLDMGSATQTRGVLAHVILPSNLRKIGYGAFQYAGLVGSIAIPEGVEEIEPYAFANNNITGEVKLPSTLKRIGEGAFADNPGINGQLYLYESLKEIGGHAFRGADISGPLILPSSLESYGHLGFRGTTGAITLPPKMNYVPQSAFSGSGCTKVEFHNGIIEINKAAFYDSSLSGELVLPPNLKRIAGSAFGKTQISSIVFPESLRIIEDGDGAFADCTFLTGVLTLPKNVARIPIGCFAGCINITGLVIPENVTLIEKDAFNGCSSIGSIVCEGTTPPVICENTFYGISKDNFNVVVPEGCVDAYRYAPGWREFKRITEHSNFMCHPKMVNAINTEHKEVLILNADDDWNVEFCPEWITLSKSSGSGKSEIELTFDQMPYGTGNREDRIIFTQYDGHKAQKAYCTVSQYDYLHAENSCLTIQEHTRGDGIDIVFIGDGFDGKAISEGKYLNLIKEQTEYFFAIEPYKSHRDYFDVHVTFPLSQECGVNTMNRYVNNRFGTLYGYDGGRTTSPMLITATDEVIDYALEYSPVAADKLSKSLIILVPNDNAYDGCTQYLSTNGDPVTFDPNRDIVTLSICPPSNRPYPQDTRGVIQHEAGGHGFGKLADETINILEWITPEDKSQIESYHKSLGWFQNIAISSKFSEVSWADFIFDPQYSDTVDIYEGGYGYLRGVFRPELNSCMNYGIPYYNVISRLDIMRRIIESGGELFSMDYFYANDTTAWGDTNATTRNGATTISLSGSAYGSSNTHVAPMFCGAKQMGDIVRDIRSELKSKTK